eukprot:TRINITY_DN6434_c0_g1_i1.p1 TRINITY_DN6434_c0_g1~~TRINITY_DN6434_c0_g1_i1.p1  ORF type:complete len:256 (-),score=44.77 TRINITY_DN6434_c0_g1_i1:165-932(-)
MFRSKVLSETRDLTNQIQKMIQRGDYSNLMDIVVAFQNSISSAAEDYLTKLPQEVIEMIFEQCKDIKDVYRLSMVSKKLHNTINNEEYWKRRSIALWNKILPNEPTSTLTWIRDQFDESQPWAYLGKCLWTSDARGTWGHQLTKRHRYDTKYIEMGIFDEDGYLIYSKEAIPIRVSYEGSSTLCIGLMVSNGYGLGVIASQDGSVYAGEAHIDEPDGDGVQKFPNGVMYSGRFYGGTLQGKGTMTWPNGFSYSGK